MKLNLNFSFKIHFSGIIIKYSTKVINEFQNIYNLKAIILEGDVKWINQIKIFII